MASFWYPNALAQALKAGLDMDGAGADVRALLLSTNTTADTERDSAFVADIGTLDEYDGANYARKSLAGEVVTSDPSGASGKGRAYFDATDLTEAQSNYWANLGAGTRSIAGILLIKFVTNDADSVPLLWIDNAPQLPFNGNGGKVEVTWDALGVAEIANAA